MIRRPVLGGRPVHGYRGDYPGVRAAAKADLRRSFAANATSEQKKSSTAIDFHPQARPVSDRLRTIMSDPAGPPVGGGDAEVAEPFGVEICRVPSQLSSIFSSWVDRPAAG